MLPFGCSSTVVRFDVFEADLRAAELYKGGRKIRLQVLPFQALALLLERPGEIVTREELQQKLWSGDTFVDFEHSLNTAIKKLRQALGDVASSSIPFLSPNQRT
jgi:DNA-binding winged helix-turn-helix (wHTH) protein